MFFSMFLLYNNNKPNVFLPGVITTHIISVVAYYRLYLNLRQGFLIKNRPIFFPFLKFECPVFSLVLTTNWPNGLDVGFNDPFGVISYSLS